MVEEALKELLQGNATAQTQEPDVSVAPSPNNDDKRTLQHQKRPSTIPPKSRVQSNASTTYSQLLNSPIESGVFHLVDEQAADFYGVGQKGEPSQKLPPPSPVTTDHQRTTPALTELESLRVAYDLASDQYRGAVQYADAYRTIQQAALPPGQSIDSEVAAMVAQLEI